MATKIVTKNSSTASAVPTTSDLVQGELAVNVADKKLFTEDNSGAIIELADGVKLAGIEASADVTDTANVTAAGALMDSELTSEASVKALNQGVATTDSPSFAGLTVDTDTLAVDSTNNRVGIGTTSPNRSLEANSTQQVVASFKSTSTDSARISFSDANTTDDTKVTIGSTGDALKINTLGSERMRIDSSGNVGIGTSSPSTILDVKGAAARIRISDTDTAGTTGIEFVDSGGTKDAEIEVGNSTQYLAFKTATAERMRILADGKVGIGTTAPASKAHILGSSNDTPSQANANLNIEGAGGNGMLFGTQATSPYRSYIQAGFVDNLATATYDLLLNPQGGKVGIRTTSPEYNLDVTAADNVTTTTALSVQNASRNYGLGLGAYTLTNRNIGGSATTVDYTFDIGRHAIFKTNNAERIRINSSGTLLVGKSNSATNLTGLEVHGSGSVFSSISSGNTYHVKNTTNNVFTFYVGYTGGVINYQANNVNLSDEREKKNIEPLESKWDSVKSWSLKTFHYNHQADESIKNYGVIAQDVEQTNPEAIDVYQKDEDTERKGVKEQQMMWMAIKALQEAQTRIETLETRIAALEE